MSDRSEARHLIHELLDGSIDREGFERLQEILLHDDEVRQDYYALMTTDQMLVDNFEMPDAMPVRPQVPVARQRRRVIPWRRVILAAAAVVVAGFSLHGFIRSQTPRVTMAGSVDSHFLVDGQPVTSGMWAKGQTLEVKNGLVFARLNPSTKACIDGTATVVLTSNDGDLDLRRGRVFFEVGPGAPDFHVKVAGATVRHIGTDFGLLATDGPAGEVHVLSGSVSVERPSAGSMVVSAGQAAEWKDGGDLRFREARGGSFRRAAPADGLVFDEDFSEPKGTQVEGKKPDVGQPWVVRDQHSTTRAGGGLLDTSGGFRHLAAGLLEMPDLTSAPVYLMTFATAAPHFIGDKKRRLSGIERITLLAADRRPICSVVALAREGHQWKLRDETTKQESEITAISAIEPNELTLRYDPAGEKVTLHDGSSPQGRLLAELPLPGGARPVEFELWNDYGGDLALKKLSVRVVSYPGTSR